MKRTYQNRVISIHEQTRAIRAVITGTDPDGNHTWEIERESLGWFILLDGTNESFRVGDAKPADLAVGDTIEITLRKI
jgi:hypothetical protein